jgi:hypothetical protein
MIEDCGREFLRKRTFYRIVGALSPKIVLLAVFARGCSGKSGCGLLGKPLRHWFWTFEGSEDDS